MRFRRSSSPGPGSEARPTSGRVSFPSIWIGSFRSGEDWHADAEHRDAMVSVLDAIDDRMLSSRHPFNIDGWCVVCGDVRPLAMAWHLGGIDAEGSVNPAWTLNACCHECGLVSRQRALIEFLQDFPSEMTSSFVAEQVTPSFTALQRMFPGIVGAEYLGADHVGGRDYPQGSGEVVRHEDLNNLSFADASFDLVITQDVFEHIADYPGAFAECRRVLRTPGRLVFTVPFFADLTATEVRATIDADGAVTHLLPPEVHGNPIGDGSLCFQHFGWDMLDSLRAAGFADAVGHLYWGPWSGHLGMPFFVFEAVAR